MPPAPLPAELEAAVAGRDARRFCELILPAVSRTFAIGIRALPGDLGRAVLVAYLICRIADTVEDAPGIAPEVKGPLLDRLLTCFDGAEASDAYPALCAAVTGEPAHLALVRHADLVFAHFRTLPAPTQAIVRRWVAEMAMGMKKFVFLYPDGIRIQTVEEFREYCYYVAGTVGYLLTDLWHEHSPAIAARATSGCARPAAPSRGAADGEHPQGRRPRRARRELDLRPRAAPPRARQLAGRAARRRAHPRDARRGGAPHPAGLGDLDDARRYLLLIPRRAVRIRLFCILPLLYAHATLRDLGQTSAMLRPGGSVKISRREVKALLTAALLLAGSNRAVRWLVDRVRRREFRLAG
jgi:farnesyl-diphosphate farnesyltransferase